jgi:hypothetical protein
MIYCDRYPEQRRGAEWDPTVRSNINATVEALFEGESPAAQALFYTYAVMSCQAYLDAFEAVLYTSADPSRPPKIPIVRDINIRQQIASLGCETARCERADANVHIPESLRSNWPDGVTEFKLEREAIDCGTGIVTLLGTNGECATISGVNTDVLNLRISGHSVILKWLRERHYVYLRRTFLPSDLMECISLIARIDNQARILLEVSSLLRHALDTEDLLEPPNC